MKKCIQTTTTECGWNQMSLSSSLYSQRDIGSLTNHRGYEAPSHWECHHSIPGSAQTYILRACEHMQMSWGLVHRDVYTVLRAAQAYSNWYVRPVNLRMPTHLHMSMAVVVQAVIQGDRSYATAPRLAEGARPQRDSDESREMSFIHCHSPVTQPSFISSLQGSAHMRSLLAARSC